MPKSTRKEHFDERGSSAVHRIPCSQADEAGRRRRRREDGRPRTVGSQLQDARACAATIQFPARLTSMCLFVCSAAFLRLISSSYSPSVSLIRKSIHWLLGSPSVLK